MSNRTKLELGSAIIVSVTVLSLLAFIGLNGAPNSREDIIALAGSKDNLNMFKPNGLTVTKEFGSANGTEASRASTPVPTSTVTRTTIRVNANTATPIRVPVGTQKRAWVFYHGPATIVRADAFAPMPLSSLPRPANDNGRGLHWFPTTHQTKAVVDRFVPELVAMRIRWVVVLQGMHDWDLIANDYLVDRLIANGIMPIMRIDRQVGPLDLPRLGWIVARYRERGVRYFQIFNEPNVEDEWGVESPHSPERFVSYWIQAADVIAANGGLPGLSPMSAQDDGSDLAFFQSSLEEIARVGRYDLINITWISVHNYGGYGTGGKSENDGFFRYRQYDTVARQVLGGSLPIIGSEGGLGDADATAREINLMFDYTAKGREPNFLAFSAWLIGNAVGGGWDARWEAAAWFTGTLAQVRSRSVVDRVKAQ